MSLLRRRAMYKADELPAGYKRCKWLSSKNDAYLITDYYPKIGDAVEIYLSLDAGIDYDVPISATSEYDSSRMLIIMFGRVNTFFKYFTNGAASKVYLPQYIGGEPRKIVIDKDGRLIDYTGYLVTSGEVGKIGTCRVVRSKKVKLNSEGTAYLNPIVKLTNDAETEADAPAVTIYLKRDTQVERERKADAGLTNIYTNKHYGVALTNTTKVVLAKFKK